MAFLRSLGFTCAGIALALCSVPRSFAQYSIHTIAGGGPNNAPALQSSLGYAQSIAFDSAGNVYIANSYVASQILKVSTTGTVTVVAGNGTMGYSGDGGPPTLAALNRPEGVFVDASGDIFIADTENNVIREVLASNGTIATVAGNGIPGYSGDGGPATAAQLSAPYGVFVDGSGNIFIADTENSVIREVLAGTGTIQTVAGNYTSGAGFSGDNGPATSAQLDIPEGVFVDASGNIFIADTYNSVVREVTAANGNIQTVAGHYYDAQAGFACQFTGDGGSPTSAFLCLPNSVFVDGSGSLYVADTANYGIRKVVSATISTIAGTLGTYGYSGDGGAATSALLQYPGGVSLDASGNIFIADTDNYVIREVTSGQIQPFAGNHTLAYSGDGGLATAAQLHFPAGAAIDASGNVYIADTNNSAIRVFNAGAEAITVAGVTIQPGDIQTVVGTGIACATPPTSCGDGGPPASAELNFPYSVFLDAFGNIFIADTGLPSTESSAIRVVNTQPAAITIAGTTIQPSTIETVAGTLGTAGFAGDGGLPTSAQLFNPQGVFVDAAGNIYIADTENSAIRVVNVGTQALLIAGVTVQPGSIGTVAGTPPTACMDRSSGCGDNGVATGAFLNSPTGISLDAGGNIFVADSSNSAIRVINSGTQAITVAGTNIAPGNILTVAGTLGQDGYSGDDGPPTSALLNTPYGVSVDSLGNIFISDTFNSTVREVVGIAGTIQSIAGSGAAGFSGDGGSAATATLNGPQSVVLGPTGNLFIADTQNSRVRELISTVAVTVQPISSILAFGGTQQFLATVTGASNANVTWQVNGVTGGSTAAGTISDLGLYQAPASDPGSGITVTAISNANGTTSGSSQVTLAAAGAPAISVTTTPSGVTVVYTSTKQAFAANVTGETNTAVSWEVNGTPGGDSTAGTIDNTGAYSAPATVPTQALIMITAVSQADATVFGSYPITIVTAPTASEPSPQTISAGGTANFSLALKANTGNPHNPITLSCLQSTLPAGASCSFSPATITPAATAVSFSLTVSVPAASASSHGQHTNWLTAELTLAFSPLAGILLLAGSRRHAKLFGLVVCVALLPMLVACGGGSNSGSSPSSNPVTYNIQVQGTTATQPNAVVITVVQLTVQ